MTAADAFAIAASIIASLGGGTLLVFAFSNWLGKVWADRLMQKEQAAHARDLERLRSDLEAARSSDLEKLKKQLDVHAATQLREVHDKLAIYRSAVDIVAEFLADFDRAFMDGAPPPDARERFDRFNRGRMRAYGYMAMLAPQSVMDAFDSLVDYCFLVAGGNAPYEWPPIRNRALALLNEIRKDVGIDKSPIEYRGEL